MAEICAYDRSNPLLKPLQMSGRTVTAFEPTVALRVCELIAEGVTLSKIFDDKNRGVLCSKRTWFQWVINYKECARAFNEARALSAFEMEDSALDKLAELLDMPGSPQKVAAYRAYVDQLRWSAGRRNPTVFSEKAPVNVTVPIQINTSLDMGKGDGAQKAPEPTTSIYTLTASVENLPPAYAEEAVEAEPFDLVSAKDAKPKPMLSRPTGRPMKAKLTPKGKA